MLLKHSTTTKGKSLYPFSTRVSHKRPVQPLVIHSNTQSTYTNCSPRGYAPHSGRFSTSSLHGAGSHRLTPAGGGGGGTAHPAGYPRQMLLFSAYRAPCAAHTSQGGVPRARPAIPARCCCFLCTAPPAPLTGSSGSGMRRCARVEQETAACRSATEVGIGSAVSAESDGGVTPVVRGVERTRAGSVLATGPRIGGYSRPLHSQLYVLIPPVTCR